MMTTMAALMGALPIALGYGADGESRRPLGLVIVGGLLVSQLITLYVTPVIYLYLETFQEKVLDRSSFFRSSHTARREHDAEAVLAVAGRGEPGPGVAAVGQRERGRRALTAGRARFPEKGGNAPMEARVGFDAIRTMAGARRRKPFPRWSQGEACRLRGGFYARCARQLERCSN